MMPFCAPDVVLCCFFPSILSFYFSGGYQKELLTKAVKSNSKQNQCFAARFNLEFQRGVNFQQLAQPFCVVEDSCSDSGPISNNSEHEVSSAAR